MTGSMAVEAPLQALLARLSGVKKGGKDGQWYARCPAHPDRQASLSVNRGDVRVRLNCHRGCAKENVLAKVGMVVADLYPERGRSVKWLREFRYLDADGVVLYRVRRGEDSKGRRWIMEHPTDDGWAKGYSGPKVLYCLPNLIRSPDLEVWVTEGERDADTLKVQGLLVTTVANSTWANVDLEPLRGREVVLVADGDAAGWKRATAAREALSTAGANVLRTVGPLPGCKDVTEHIGRGQSVDLLMPVDLDGEPPPAAPVVEVPPRSAYGPEGRALYARVPTGVLLGLLQEGCLELVDFAVWVLLEDRAGPSGLALINGSEIGRLLGVDRHAVRASLDRLSACGLATESKRGRWLVFNPSQEGRSGSVDPSITFRNRDPRSPQSSSSHLPENTSPGNGASGTVQEGANGAVATTPSATNGGRGTTPASEATDAVPETTLPIVEADALDRQDADAWLSALDRRLLAVFPGSAIEGPEF